MATKAKHIILGAGGAIGTVLTRELLSHNEAVKLVSRSGAAMHGAQTTKADLLRVDEVMNAVEQDSVVYLTAGLAYNLETWRSEWPLVMENTITACKVKNAKLIFFDNVYMYGRVSGAMTEETPINPTSKKGEVRAKIAQMLLDETKKGNLKALIARSADFYGPHAARTSVFNMFVISNLMKGKKAQVFVNAKTKHSYTYTGDCGKAMYLLAGADDAYGQVWHIPTASPAMTTKELIRITAQKLNAKPEYMVLYKWMINMAGMFDKNAKGAVEMLYQQEYDYILDSSKFEKHFNYIPNSYEKGIEETIKYLRTLSK